MVAPASRAAALIRPARSTSRPPPSSSRASPARRRGGICRGPTTSLAMRMSSLDGAATLGLEHRRAGQTRARSGGELAAGDLRCLVRLEMRAQPAARDAKNSAICRIFRSSAATSTTSAGVGISERRSGGLSFASSVLCWEAISSSMYWRITASKFSSPGKPSARARVVSQAPGQVATIRSIADRVQTARVRATSAPATRSSAATIAAAVIDSPGTLTTRLGPKRLGRKIVAGDETLDRGRGGKQPEPSAGIDRTDGLVAVQRLAHDPAGERGRGRVGPAGPHADRRQPQHAAVDETFARAVGDQQFGHRLLRAIGGLRRDRGRIEHRLRQVAAVHRHRAGEHEPRTRAAAAADVEQPPRRVEIDRACPGRTPSPAMPLTTAAR